MLPGEPPTSGESSPDRDGTSGPAVRPSLPPSARAAAEPSPVAGSPVPHALEALEALDPTPAGSPPRPTAVAGSGRPSRWDRPPEPHDWRWVIGGLGRVLISVGVLMFAFVGYQLWGTGIQTAQAQNRLEDEFSDLLELTSPVDTTVVPATTEPTADTVPDTTAPADTTPPSTTVPPARLTPPALGDPLAKLTIPAIDLDKIVIEGVRASDLEDGPGHFPETPLPGQLGNAAIAGHRTTHGQPFIRIDELQVGDDIVVTTVVGEYTYVVTGQQIVSPDDYQLVIPTVDPSVATLTLTSCHPKFSAKQRIVITAVLDVERSDQVTESWTASAGGISGGVIPGDEEPAAETTVAETTAPATTAPATTEPVATASTTEEIDPLANDSGDAGSDAGEELFANRWFSDPGAFSQVALWGVGLILVALAATWLSRRVRRNWVGALAGIVPFVFVLYFWFENVNRLLPPNL